MTRSTVAQKHGLLALSEADWQAQIVELAEPLGWHVWHDNDSRRNRAGLPDLELLRGATMLRLELKTDKGTVSDAQQAYIDRLKQVKFVYAAVARPRHWDEIAETLKGAAR
jgi:hypothetical protein